MSSVIKKRRRKISRHKYRKRLKRERQPGLSDFVRGLQAKL